MKNGIHSGIPTGTRPSHLATAIRLALIALPKPDRRSEFPLYVRLSHGAGAKRHVALGLRVHKSDWNGRKHGVRRSAPDHAALNRLLAERLRTAQAAARELLADGRHVDLERAKAVVEAALHPEPESAPAEAPGLVANGLAIKADWENRGKIGAALVYGTALNHFAETVRVKRERVEKPRLSLEQVRALEAQTATLSGRAADTLDW